jgi:hypothetical protein
MVGCSVGKPPISEVATIEAVTSKSACVGALSRWHRAFAFQKRGNRINNDMISVTYIQAGHRGLAAGRVIAEPDWQTIIDDSQHRVAGGEYDRTARRFSEWSCGCNFPPYNVDHATECVPKGG